MATLRMLAFVESVGSKAALNKGAGGTTPVLIVVVGIGFIGLAKGCEDGLPVVSSIVLINYQPVSRCGTFHDSML